MIYADIHRQRLTLVNEHIVADTIDYLEMKCNFLTDDWDGLEKWAHFANGGTVYDIRLTHDGIRKEDHLNLTAGEWRVYLHGNEFADGMVVERITTVIEVLHVLPAGILDGEPLPEIPASVTEQILARLDKVEKNGGGGGGTGGSLPGIADNDEGKVLTVVDGEAEWADLPEGEDAVLSVNGMTGAVQLGAADVGALPASTKIPAKTSDLQNDSGFITAAVNALLNYYKKSETYTRTEVDAFIAGLDRRLNAVADSDDATLDQLSEIVAYIKANKSLIDSITTSKVSVSDIVNNLTTADVKKPLSAAQGKELKALYDSIRALYEAIVIPTKLPNPYALTFTGAATGTYDGSSAVTIHIPVVTGDGDMVTASVYMRVSDGYIQYSSDHTVWNNVIAVDELRGADGEKGDKGADGAAGTSVTISSVSESTEDGGNNTVTFSDGKTLNVRNGKRGADGKDGQNGADGKDGEDYILTEADKSDIADLVLGLLPTWEGGSY